jgi:hypothetical protein
MVPLSGKQKTYDDLHAVTSEHIFMQIKKGHFKPGKLGVLFPFNTFGNVLLSQVPLLSSALKSLTSVFGMGTGGSSLLSSP